MLFAFTPQQLRISPPPKKKKRANLKKKKNDIRSRVSRTVTGKCSILVEQLRKAAYKKKNEKYTISPQIKEEQKPFIILQFVQKKKKEHYT